MAAEAFSLPLINKVIKRDKSMIKYLNWRWSKFYLWKVELVSVGLFFFRAWTVRKDSNYGLGGLNVGWFLTLSCFQVISGLGTFPPAAEQSLTASLQVNQYLQDPIYT